MAAFSSARSAYIRFSLAFSASSSRNRVTSETLAPPYLLRHLNLKKVARLMPCVRRRSLTATPASASCRIRVAIHYIQPGKPDQNAYIERFNRSYRTEVLNAHLFESIAELQALTMTWLRIYNEERPHDSLGRVPPLTFLPRPKTARESTYKVST